MAAGESNSMGDAAPVAPNPASTSGGILEPATHSGSLDPSGGGAGGGGQAAAGVASETPVNPAGTDAVGAGDEVIKTIFDQLVEELPESLQDDNILALDAFYKKITPDHIKELPPVAKQIVHNLRRDYTQKRQRDADSQRQAESNLKQRNRQVDLREKELLARQRALAKVARSGGLSEMANKADSDLPDAHTDAGIQARAERAAAKAVGTYLEPLEQEIEQQARYQALMDFEDSHPQMKDKPFRDEVANLIKSRQDAGFRVSLPDAYHLVDSKHAKAKADSAAANQRSRDRRTRATEARAIGKSAGSGSKSSKIPKFRNAADAHEWIKANKLTTDQLRRMQ